MADAAAVEKKMSGLKLDQTPEQAVAEKKPYYEKRVQLFEQYHARHLAQMEAAKQANVAITVTLPDGSQKPAVKDVTTPLDVANMISKSLAKKAIVAKVDGEVWDMFRPLEGDCALQLLSFDDPDGREVSAGARPLWRTQLLELACHQTSCQSRPVVHPSCALRPRELLRSMRS